MRRGGGGGGGRGGIGGLFPLVIGVTAVMLFCTSQCVGVSTSGVSEVVPPEKTDCAWFSASPETLTLGALLGLILCQTLRLIWRMPTSNRSSWWSRTNSVPVTSTTSNVLLMPCLPANTLISSSNEDPIFQMDWELANIDREDWEKNSPTIIKTNNNNSNNAESCVYSRDRPNLKAELMCSTKDKKSTSVNEDDYNECYAQGAIPKTYRSLRVTTPYGNYENARCNVTTEPDARIQSVSAQHAICRVYATTAATSPTQKSSHDNITDDDAEWNFDSPPPKIRRVMVEEELGECGHIPTPLWMHRQQTVEGLTKCDNVPGYDNLTKSAHLTKQDNLIQRDNLHSRRHTQSSRDKLIQRENLSKHDSRANRDVRSTKSGNRAKTSAKLRYSLMHADAAYVAHLRLKGQLMGMLGLAADFHHADLRTGSAWPPQCAVSELMSIKFNCLQNEFLESELDQLEGRLR